MSTAGWRDEGVGWYAADVPSDVPMVKEFLLHALEQIGSTLYVYGGTWNEADNGPGVEARCNNCSHGCHYLTVADELRWNRGTLADPEGLTNMSSEEVMAALFA